MVVDPPQGRTMYAESFRRGSRVIGGACATFRGSRRWVRDAKAFRLRCNFPVYRAAMSMLSVDEQQLAAEGLYCCTRQLSTCHATAQRSVVVDINSIASGWVLWCRNAARDEMGGRVHFLILQNAWAEKWSAKNVARLKEIWALNRRECPISEAREPRVTTTSVDRIIFGIDFWCPLCIWHFYSLFIFFACTHDERLIDLCRRRGLLASIYSLFL